MLVYRITNKKYSSDLSGIGAAIYGGRWNKKGTPVLYTSESKAVALLETIVHLPPMILPKLDLVSIEIPDNSLLHISSEELPENWKSYPAPSILSEIGEQWIKNNQKLALKVPSSIMPDSYNIILNCQHKDYNKIKILDKTDFKLDPRLLK